MLRNPVSSSVIRSIGYDQVSKTLEVQFKTGAVYQYKRVDSSTYLSLINADSIGNFFNQHIRGVYSEQKTR